MWQVFWTSRLVVFLSGVFAVLLFGAASSGGGGNDPFGLTRPFGFFGNLLVSPFARWDSSWYLLIAERGYGNNPERAEFFPLYPLITRVVGHIVVSDLIAGLLVSLVSFAIGLFLLYRLVELELDGETARITLLLIAFCPTALFFSAVYSESLFLALSVGCFLQARRGRWASAGILGGLAALERNSGIMLVVPIILLYLYGPRQDRPPPGPRDSSWVRRLIPRYPIRPNLAWVLLVPAGTLLFLISLSGRPGFSFTSAFDAKKYWLHYFAGPYGGVWHGIVAAWDGIRQIVHGPAPPVYFRPAIGFFDPLSIAGQNLILFGFLVLGVIGLIGAFRRLPLAYGAYALAALAIPLSYPVTWQPLGGLSRYEAVLFPLFMWGALWVRRRNITTASVASLAVFLGLFTAEFATWRFVA
ncbi:MAG TPA: mannosyltransferase family protein [Solirubrobacteraceae bacterium]|nr:mannosyltransferase family protein [Solirubrobacteraceae bacterium]